MGLDNPPKFRVMFSSATFREASMARIAWLAVGATGVLALAACERGASAPSRAQRDEGRPAAAAASGASTEGGGSYASRDADRGASTSAEGDRGSSGGGDRDRPREETPLFHGKPLWADNRKHTARENAEYQCDKHGVDIGSKSLDDCLTKVHAFVDSPPAGAEVVTRVRNGDKLMYDGKSNIFAVARKDGAPRTFFKPREGETYWREQKEEAQSGRSARRRSGGDDEGTARGN